MRWNRFAQQAQGPSSSLPLMGEVAAAQYLACRPGLLREENQDPMAWERPRRLLDRAAAFWLTHAWLEHQQTQKGLVLFSPRPSGTALRVFWMGPGEQVGNPWEGPPVLLEQLGFAIDAIQAYGALAVPYVIEDGWLNRSYGAAVVRAHWEHCCYQKAQALEEGLVFCGPSEEAERRRF